jgi:hypothetical protein
MVLRESKAIWAAKQVIIDETGLFGIAINENLASTLHSLDIVFNEH